MEKFNHELTKNVGGWNDRLTIAWLNTRMDWYKVLN